MEPLNSDESSLPVGKFSPLPVELATPHLAEVASQPPEEAESISNYFDFSTQSGIGLSTPSERNNPVLPEKSNDIF